MVIRPEPVAAIVRQVEPPRPLLALTPSGERFDQDRAAALAAGPGFSLLCGRYEGFDARILQTVVDAAIQVHGGEGVADAELSYLMGMARALRLADGPDEVHRGMVARLELRKYR